MVPMGNDNVTEIKDRLSIVDVVGQHVKLHRAGKSMTGLCPFHKEKTPSFHVSVERGSYHCFGCGEGGDIFSFVQKIDGVDFKAALTQLAERAGVTLDTRGGSHEDTSKKDRLRAAMSKAAEWYKTHLHGAGEAYAASRGLSPKTIEGWQIGFAPEGWRGLLEALTLEGFKTEELLSAGLIKEADGKPGTYYDRFRNRLMFPISDISGRVVAFTGRAFSPDEHPVGYGAVPPAKYLNSPETPLYHKSELLFGMDKAKDAIRVRGFALLVEGQMDALLVHQAGFENVIALSGTALTDRHIALIKRYSENLMLAFDADTAGLSATAKSAQLALRAGMRVKAVRLPKGTDPADLVLQDVQDFTARVKEAKPVVEFFLSVLAEGEREPHRLLRMAEQVVLPLIAAVKSPMERDHFVQAAARALSLSEESVRESLAHVPEIVEVADVSVAGVSESIPKKSQSDLRAGQLFGIARAYADTPLAKRIEAEYSRITGVQALDLENVPESAVFEAEQTYGENPSAEAADELLGAFEKAVIREAYQEATMQLRRAESAGDAGAVTVAQKRCAELSAKLAHF